jgi:glycosyltransferase involved in cell wall biosynthesis
MERHVDTSPIDVAVNGNQPTEPGGRAMSVSVPANGKARPVGGHAANGHHRTHAVSRHWTEAVPSTDTVSVIIPALNEQHNIGWVLERMPPTIDEVILVDGHSIDRTVEIARAVRPDIVVVQQASRGKGAALRAGFEAATSDFIVMIDADGSMDPGEIYRYVMPLMNGYDLVKGSRFLDGGGSTDLTLIRRFGSKAFVHITNALFFVRFTDLCYGFCSFRRDCLKALALTAHGFEIETEIAVHAAKAQLRIAEVPSMERERRSGVSNLHAFRDGQRVLRTLMRERVSNRNRPVVDPISEPVLGEWAAAAERM